ncbi:unnamed protein product [Mytilus edulis]|uniref:Uncharacterized protein n=1 Tax=Mytilus edulis TaxID=6550 RepID=A0A8S3TZ14_MYTED|nr:unnamed protein product [Mytilus edulis]
MDSDTPSDEISLRTVLDAVNRQKKAIEVLVDTKISEKINSLRDEIHGTSQCMKSQVKKLKSDSQYKWRSEEDESKIIRAENRAIRKKKAKGKPAGKRQQIPSTANPSFNPQQPFRGDQPYWYGGFPYAKTSTLENLNGDHASTMGRTSTLPKQQDSSTTQKKLVL